MIRGLIFDFDGLILETEGPEYRAWKEIFKEYNAELPLSEWGVCVGSSADTFDALHYLEAKIGQALPHAEIKERQRQRSWELVLQQQILPGVAEILEQAENLSPMMAVASSSPRSWVEGHLQRLSLRSYFTAVICVDDVDGRAKPDPALYKAALRALRLSPDQAMAFEDSQNGVIAAKAAGIYCVAVPNEITRDMDFSLADRRIASLADVPLEQLLAGAGGNGKVGKIDVTGRSADGPAGSHH